jgi:DNA-binding XRE family transcriptional regulator
MFVISTNILINTAMPNDIWVTAAGLAALAKQARQRADKSKAEAARDFRVNRATIQQAEEMPNTSLAKLRIRMIEAYLLCTVDGPLYRLRHITKRSGQKSRERD